MNNEILKTGKKVLRPRARIVHTFGDELISSDVVALIELVKNAYDADAKRVLIRFSGPLIQDNGTIEVIDSGHGMSLDIIENTWMEPATPYRKRDPHSEKGRRVLGEKGIGRFAASRLANHLNLITRQKGTNIEISAYVDWTKFDDVEKFLDEIELRWETRIPEEICPAGTIKSLCWDAEKFVPEKLEKGTILRMDSLKSDWDDEKIEKLLEGLSRLITPNSIAPPDCQLKDLFEIYVEFPKPFEEKSGLIEPPEILKYPHYSLKGYINKSGEYHFFVKVKGKDDEIQFHGNFNFKNKIYPDCGPFYIDLRVWDRDAESLHILRQKLGLKLKQVRDLLNSTTGINVFRDGFRIMPFGEQGNDWLQLDKRRYLNPTLRISNDQISGYILISGDKNPELRDQSNREGLIENPALKDFRNIIIQSLTFLEIRRYDARHPKGSTKVVSKGLFSDFTLKAIQNQISTKYPQDTVLLASIKSKGEELDEKVSQVKEVLSRYQRLATLGKLIDIVLHDGGIPLSILGNEARDAIDNFNKWQKIGDSEKSILSNQLILIRDQADILQTVFKRIKPFGGRKRGRPEQICLETSIENAVALYHREVKNTGATVLLPKTCTLVTVDSAEIQEVIINMLDNSLYWLNRVPLSQRDISIDVYRNQNNEVEILFSDSGPGIEPEFQERIFDPYFTTKTNGIGLGLSIAGEIVSEYYGGELELMNSGKLPGATFRIILRKRV